MATLLLKSELNRLLGEQLSEALIALQAEERKVERSLAELIRNATKDTRVPWIAVLHIAMDDGHLDPQQIKGIVKMSGSTVSRWISGDVVPHDVVRQLSGQRIADFIEARV